jgi:hypothetical protein
VAAQLVVRVTLLSELVVPMVDDGGDSPDRLAGCGIGGQKELGRGAPPVVIERVPVTIQHEVPERVQRQDGERIVGVQPTRQLLKVSKVRLGLNRAHLATIGDKFLIQRHKNPQAAALT